MSFDILNTLLFAYWLLITYDMLESWKEIDDLKLEMETIKTENESLKKELEERRIHGY